jgi:hypothetical protein
MNARRTIHRRTLRFAAVVAVLVAGVLPAARADHGEAGARSVTAACPEAQVPDAGFADMAGWPQGFVDAVDCIVAYGVALGTSATAYSPDGAVTRAQMASFVVRMLDPVDGYTRPANPPDAFSDDVASVHQPNINVAAADGLVKGYAGGLFRPGASVTRAQMATFVVGALKRAGASLPATSPDAFPDDGGDVHEANINTLADVHVVVGDSSGTYGPLRPVTRAQMALFVARGLDYLVAEERLTPPFDPTAPRNVVATAISKTAIRVTWDPPTDGTPETYKVYRVLAPGGGDCPLTGHNEVGFVSAAAGGGRSFENSGLTGGTTYCYRVTAVDDGKESELSAPSAKARATTPTGVQMTTADVDTAAETVTVNYTESVTCGAGAASQFSYGGASTPTPAQVTCSGTTAVLKFANATGPGELTYRQSVDNPSARVKSGESYALSPQTIVVSDGAPYITLVVADDAANTVTLTYNETVRCVAGSRGQFTYGGALVNTIDGCDDAATKSVVLALPVTGPAKLVYTQSADPALRIGDEGGNHAKSPDSMDDTPPKLVKAVADSGTNQVVATFDQPITCSGGPGSPSQFTYAGASPANAAATQISCAGANATLTFADVVGGGELLYTQSATAGERIVDKVAQPAPTGQKVQADPKPLMVFGAPDTSTNKLTVTYSEAVTCPVSARERFTYASASPTRPEHVSCNGSPTVVLTFSVITGAGTGSLTYSPGGVANEPTWIKDLAGNPAISQSLDTGGPSISSVMVSASGGTVEVTYSESVTCVSGSAAQFSYSGAPQAATGITCGGGTPTKVTLTYPSITAPGTLTYTQSTTASLHIKDATGNSAKSPDSASDPPPSMSAAMDDPVAKRITVTYGEPISCGADTVSLFSYTATGGAAQAPTAITCSGPTTSVVLEFADNVLQGTLTYTANAAKAGVTDSALNPAGTQSQPVS